uniref:FAD/NAD(P)-binding domain-containing protein n=1 Tax=Otus sunia TaxID=257818 RepID=A0A8C8AMY1_9STRI
MIFASFLLQAVSVDFQKQKVRFMDGSSQKYNQLLIATGSHSILLKIPGADLQNVCILQTPEYSSKILELATGKNLVIVGASFVGMEVAAFLSDKAGAISVVEKKEFPFQNALGPQVGGVAMKVRKTRCSFLGQRTDTCYPKAVLDSGEKLPADVVVVGIGKRSQLGEGGSAGSGEKSQQAQSTTVPSRTPFPAVSFLLCYHPALPLGPKDLEKFSSP